MVVGDSKNELPRDGEILEFCPENGLAGRKAGNIIRALVMTASPTLPTGPARDVIGLLRERGFVQQISDEAGLGARLAAGPVCFYAGFDPTASSLHVGSLVPLIAMAHLARAGCATSIARRPCAPTASLASRNTWASYASARSIAARSVASASA